ncbi:MAG: DNA repair and recombination protein RadA [Candidatus Diapherotrites archaeon CG09_land_8_20_14_0_10_32_12]|nr:MAG: DNA repair and recombination protein RadA [Candidatus Diapherotrites archaeon CG09_land_8_20_14_0_10_32_12]
MGDIKKVSDLPGIGPAAEEKLFKGGYKTIESIAVASPLELVSVAGLGETTAAKAIAAARSSMDVGVITAEEFLEKRKTIGKVTMGSKAIDELLGGGLETQSITEVYGKYGTGKTQWCFEICVTAQLPIDKGGLDGTVFYIDSENSFRPERVIKIAEKYGLDPKEVLRNIYVARAYTADHQMLLAEKAKEIVKEKKIRVMIVDSLTAQFRSEYIGRGLLADRQQKLNTHMRALAKIAESHNIAVLVTNQVMSKPDQLFGDPTEPIGGNIVGHASKTRLYLRKSSGQTRIAKLVDSPYLPDGEVIYRVTDNGIEDQTEKDGKYKK